MAKQGRTKFTTVALVRRGEVAAFTDLTTVHETTRVYQWGTLVRRAHRGHRLGLAVKIANLRRSSASADVRRLVTWNAEVNDHMIGINHRMGFRAPLARLGTSRRSCTLWGEVGSVQPRQDERVLRPASHLRDADPRRAPPPAARARHARGHPVRRRGGGRRARTRRPRCRPAGARSGGPPAPDRPAAGPRPPSTRRRRSSSSPGACA